MLQQRELRGPSARVRAVAALLRVFSLLRVLALVSPSFQVSFFNQERLWLDGSFLIVALSPVEDSDAD